MLVAPRRDILELLLKHPEIDLENAYMQADAGSVCLVQMLVACLLQVAGARASLEVPRANRAD